TDHRLLRIVYNLKYNVKKDRKSFGHKKVQLTCIEKETIKRKFSEIRESYSTEGKNTEQKYTDLTLQIKEIINQLPKLKEKSENEIIFNDYVRELIQEKLYLKSKKHRSKEERKRLTKLYHKIKEIIKKKKYQLKYKIIEEELKDRGSVKRSEKRLSKHRDWITSLKASTGDKISKRTGLLKLATMYYENLYKNSDISPTCIDNNIGHKEYIENIPALTQSEIRTAGLNGRFGSTRALLLLIRRLASCTAVLSGGVAMVVE
ncbi:unnamed protein product, partial [Brenthis ino]